MYQFCPGTTPLLISMPHSGVALPSEHSAGFTDHARELADTDWHLSRLYEFAGDLGANILRADVSRYIIDLNRPPDNAELYPGANSTTLCPVTNFAEQPLYHSGAQPTEEEVKRRLQQYWQPYHQQIRQQLDTIRETHGIAVLFDAHSIRSRVPRLFDGQLPDFNLGSAGGSSAAASLLDVAKQSLRRHPGYSTVANQRFKGGYITRCYGEPAAGIHALQLELCQHLYMIETPPFDYCEQSAGKLQPVLRQLLIDIMAWAQQEAHRS